MLVLILIVFCLAVTTTVCGRQPANNADKLNEIRTFDPQGYKVYESMPQTGQEKHARYNKVITLEERRRNTEKSGINALKVLQEKVEMNKSVEADIGKYEPRSVLSSYSSSEKYGERKEAIVASEASTDIQSASFREPNSYAHISEEEEEEDDITFTHKPTPLHMFRHLENSGNVHSDVNFSKEPNVGKGIFVREGVFAYASEHGPERPSVVIESEDRNEFIHTSNPSLAVSQQETLFDQHPPSPSQSTDVPSAQGNYHDAVLHSETSTEESEAHLRSEQPSSREVGEPSGFTSFVTKTAENADSTQEHSPIERVAGRFVHPLQTQNFFPRDLRYFLTKYPPGIDESSVNGFETTVDTLHPQLYPGDDQLVAPYQVRHQPILHHIEHSFRHPSVQPLEQEHILVNGEEDQSNAFRFSPYQLTSPFNGGLIPNVHPSFLASPFSV